MSVPVTSTPAFPRLLAAFGDHFGGAPALVARAPGRVNLIGEHTDYNDGFVLPCAIGFQTQVALRPRTDGAVRVLALDAAAAAGAPQATAMDEFLAQARPARAHQGGWRDYVRGMVAALVRQGLAPGGADLAIAGDVPQGAGLSSSASLLVALGQAFALAAAAAGRSAPTAADLALLAQRVENDDVGCQCGVMDPLASACGVAGHALLLDCRSLALTPVPLASGLAVLVVDSGQRRGLVDSAYNLRRQQCEAAAQHFGVAALRDLDATRLAAGGHGLDPVSLRRARHVVTENERTLQATAALRAGDVPALARLMAASHASMRDDFEITTPAIDALVDALAAVLGSDGGVRMTGGGFGGCVVAVARKPAAQRALQAVAAWPAALSGAPLRAWLCEPAAGAGPCS